MAVEVKKHLDTDKFGEWLRTQLRLTGEELIRRSEKMNFSGWDMVTDISIHVTIPTYTDNVQVPDIEFCFSTLNKTIIDDFIKEHVEVINNTDES